MREMQTIVLPSSEQGMDRASSIIKNGGLVAFQTETVYGIGANALDPVAVKKIFEAKGRPQDNPVIVHVCNMVQLSQIVFDIPQCVNALSEAFWPGPLTLVLKKSESVPFETTGGLSSVAVRIPDSEVALSLIEKAGVPIAAPSANISGKPSPTTFDHVFNDLTGRVDAIIEGGTCSIGIESTVLDLTSSLPVILRPGKITREDLERILKVKVYFSNHILKQKTLFDNNPLDNKGEKQTVEKEIGIILEQVTGQDLAKISEHAKYESSAPMSPGIKYRHYAPKAKMIVISGAPESVQAAIENEKNRLESIGKKVGVLNYGLSPDQKILEIAIREFFNKLRAMDELNVDIIIASAVSSEGLGLSLMDRMIKASGYNIIHV